MKYIHDVILSPELGLRGSVRQPGHLEPELYLRLGIVIIAEI